MDSTGPSAMDPPNARQRADEAPMTHATTKDPAAVALGRKGGLKGGMARAKKLTAEERSEAARKAARARWGARD